MYARMTAAAKALHPPAPYAHLEEVVGDVASMTLTIKSSKICMHSVTRLAQAAQHGVQFSEVPVVDDDDTLFRAAVPNKRSATCPNRHAKRVVGMVPTPLYSW